MRFNLHYLQLFSLLTSLSGSKAQEVSGAVVVNPSGNWEGNDGPWSSFRVDLGSPNPQSVHLFPAFTPGYILAVDPLGCPDGYYPSENQSESDCGESRGGIFKTNLSSSWSEQGIYRTRIGASLGYAQSNGKYGFDSVSFGIDLSHQLVGTVAYEKFWTGLFGLSFDLQGSYWNLTSGPGVSFLETLRLNGILTSRTWSYTAGAYYRMSHGSLVLSGYDRFRFNSSSTLNAPLRNDSENQLTLQVKLITSSRSGQLSSTAFNASIRSDFAYMWLPQHVCDAFSSAFGLYWNSTYEIYTISDEAHDKNRASNVSVIFQLCNPENSAFCTEINFPYDVFALNAKFPLINENGSQRYFPIKPGSETTGYVLGRAFLQEAHIFMDYDKGWFNISQALFDVQTSQIVAISHPLGNSTKPTLSGGSIAGIAIGSVAAVLLILVAWIFFSWRRKRWPFKSSPVNPPPEQFAKAELTAVADLG